jgi:uncharacterized HAD superfamily protein
LSEFLERKRKRRSQAREERKLLIIGTQSKARYNTKIEAEGTASRQAIQYRFLEIVQLRKVQSIQQRECTQFEAVWHKNLGVFGKFV